MMPDSDDLRDERDRRLVNGFISGARGFRLYYWEWIQEEVKDCKFKAEFLEPALSGTVKSSVQAAIQRLEEIDRRELKEVIDNVDTKCSEIEDGAWNNVLDAFPYLEEGLHRFERLVRELLDIRSLLDSLWESGT